MTSSAGSSPHQLLQSTYTNNQNNHGIIGNSSNNFVISGDIDNSDIVIEINDSEDDLDRLLGRQVSNDALRSSFHSPPECHPNTHITVREEIASWIDESESVESPLLWLNGPVAVGKSVIAKTISGFHDQIVAAFFFSTSSDKSAATLFPTLAWQLARSIPDTRKHIIASLKNSGSGSLQTSQIEEQFDLLILQPLKSTALRSRPVMVIDGVDECTEENMLVRFLRVLVQACKGGDMPVRFIICSRPEPRIQAILGRPNVQEPQLPSLVSRSVRLPLRSLSLIVLSGLLALVIVALILSLVWGFSSVSRMGPFIVLISLAASIASFVSFRPARLHTHLQRSRGFLQGLWELYRPIRLGVDKDATSSETCTELPDALDTICLHSESVIATIQIGFSQECKQDIARYLTDKFNEISQLGDSTSP